ncbi:hypothetical protein P691DRAFT_623892, partial [Macrolepiota fuliginosa MF-IS2]
PPTSGKKGKLPGPPKKAKWCTLCDGILLETLKKEAAAGNQADNSWKRSVWTACEAALAGQEGLCGGAPKKPKSCEDHWGLVNGVVTCSDDVWSHYVEAHPAVKDLCGKPFPHYNEMSFLIEGHHATGAWALDISELTD